jgi:CheY-like chemotaxis protein
MAGSSKILLVEDNVDIVELYSRVLQQHYELQTATTVDEALAKATVFQPDVVLLDVMLPGGKSGLDALMLLRTNPAYHCVDVPIVILTNLGLTGQLLQAWEEYADGYVIKAEILPTQLPQIVDSFLKPPTASA